MGEERSQWERRVFNRVTVIKLAVQLLERRTDLSEQQRDLTRTAIEATDALIGDLVERWQAEPPRLGREHAPASSVAEPSTPSAAGPSRAARSGRTV